jgi:hypothetical protein
MPKQSERIKALEKQVELLNEVITLQNRLFIKEEEKKQEEEKDFKLKENMRRRIT